MEVTIIHKLTVRNWLDGDRIWRARQERGHRHVQRFLKDYFFKLWKLLSIATCLTFLVVLFREVVALAQSLASSLQPLLE